MGIVILEDQKTIAGDSKNLALKRELEKRGHYAELFNGRTPPHDAKIEDAIACANKVYNDFILPRPAYGAVLDLIWFGQADYGERMWLEIRRLVLPEPFRLVVYSTKISPENRAEIARALDTAVEFVVQRHTKSIYDVATMFDDLRP